MSVFLYYVPGKKISTREEVAAAGLAYLLDDDISPTPCGVNKGPGDNGAGAVLSFAPKGFTGELPPTGYYPDRQEWQKFGEVWVGIDKERPPTAEGLVRRNTVAGHEVELVHGKWIVPCARHFFAEHGSPLPRVFAPGPDGKMIEEPDACYAELCRGADVRWYWFCKDFGMEEYLGAVAEADEPPRPSMQERFDFAVFALAVNYRVSTREILSLREISTASLLVIEKAVFDWQTVAAFSEMVSKKNTASTPDGSSSNDGVEAN